jgi:hypothetical protein
LATARARRLGGGAARTAGRAALLFPLAALYTLVAALAGIDLAWLAGPRVSFALALTATATSWLALAIAADCACTLARAPADPARPA